MLICALNAAHGAECQYLQVRINPIGTKGRRNKMTIKPKIFVDGFYYKTPHPKAPDFIKAEIDINAEKFTAWLRQYAEKRQSKSGHDYHACRITIKESRNGKAYVELNDWKPGQKNQTPDTPPAPQEVPDFDTENFTGGDVPF